MNIEMKNIKHSSIASEETLFYRARLYVQGVAVAEVGNDGRGGPDYVYPLGTNAELKANREAVAEAEKFQASLPPIVTDIKNADGTAFEFPNSLESKCHDLLEAWLTAKDIKRILKRVCYTLDGDTGIYRLPAKWKPTPEVFARIAEEKPEWKILNTRPMAEILEVYNAQ